MLLPLATRGACCHDLCVMAAPNAKKPRSGGPRMSLQLTFEGMESMEGFKTRMERIKRAFAPAGGQPLKPVELFNKLFDLAESYLAEADPNSTNASTEVTQHLLPSSGIYTH